MNTSSYLKASFWERLLALIIDELIVVVLVFILKTIIPFQSITLKDFLAHQGFFGIILIIYNIWLVTWQGATVGKKMLKIKVVTSSYSKIPLGKVILREFLGKAISSAIFNLGYFWTLIDKKNQSWHDKIAGTLVVKVNDKGEFLQGEDRSITKRDYFLFSILFLLFGGPGFFLLIYLFIAQPHQVRGQAMAPNYLNGQYFLASKISYTFSSPKRGEVIIFKAPKNPQIDYIKRIIGLPGEKIKIENGKVYINGQMLSEPYLSSDSYTRAGNFLQEGISITIPENNYFVLGDNRNNSVDSREWGFVPKKNIEGKFWFRYR